MEGDTKKTQTGYANFFRPPTVQDGFERLGLSSAVGGLVGFALSGSITGTAEGALGGGVLYGTGMAGTFAYDQVVNDDWSKSYSAQFFGGEGTPLEVAFNPFHGGAAGHAVYYGGGYLKDKIGIDGESTSRWWNHVIGNDKANGPANRGYETAFYHGILERVDPKKNPHYAPIWSGLQKDLPQNPDGSRVPLQSRYP